MRLLLTLALVTGFSAASTTTGRAADLPYRDDFSAATKEGRKAQRGPWKMEEGEARCTQDDELFKKLKSHGPVLWYDVPFANGVVKFEYQPDASCRSFVFTINAQKGHLFRFVTSARGTGLRAFVLKDDATHDAIPLGGNGPALKPGEWTSVTVEFAGSKATVKIGGSYAETVEHPSIAKAKATVGLGFSFGTAKFRNFQITGSK